MPVILETSQINESGVASSPDMLLSGSNYRLGFALVLLLLGILYVSVAVNWPKFSRAEVFFAECAREMLKGSNYVTPLYHGQPFFDKPIFAYWLILLDFKVFGVSHFVSRIPSITAALATVAATGIAAGFLAGASAGLLAAMALGSACMYFSFASSCMSDMLLTFFDTTTLVLLYAGARLQKERSRLWWFASVSMGLAFLTKGPVGVVLPAVSFAIYLIATGKISLLRFKHILSGGITFALLASPWFLALFRTNGPGAIQYFFLHENLERFTGAAYDSHRPAWYMLGCFLTGFAPWSIFLPAALFASIRQWRKDLKSPQADLELFAWLWIAIDLVFFSFSRGKIDYYALPAYPAAAVLTGIAAGKWINLKQAPALAGLWGLAICLVAVGLGSCFFLPKMSCHYSIFQWTLMPAALTLSGLLACLSLRSGKLSRAYHLLFTGICLGAIGFSWQILPGLVNLQPVLSYIPIMRKSPPETGIGIYSSLANWIDEITFQTGREPVRISGLQEMAAFLYGKHAVLLVVPEDKLSELPSSLRSRLHVLASRPNISHSINPGFAIQSGGQLLAPVPLLLVSNRR